MSISSPCDGLALIPIQGVYNLNTLSVHRPVYPLLD